MSKWKYKSIHRIEDQEDFNLINRMGVTKTPAYKWCLEHCNDRFHANQFYKRLTGYNSIGTYLHVCYKFKNEEDAAFFKLTWG